MKPIIYLIPIFVDEYQYLHDSRYISIDRSRIVVASTEKDGLSRPEVLCQMAAALPDFMPDAEISVVIACFTSESCGVGLWSPSEPLSASKACFMAKECSAVIPLTTRSREILNGRFNGIVTLSEPIYEKLIEEHFTQRALLNKIQGGDALIEILIANYDQNDFSGLRNTITTDGEGADLIRKVLGYTRHAPAALQPISGLRDLRKILRDTLTDPKNLNPPLAKLSAWGDSKWETVSGFRKVYGDLTLIKAFDSIDDYWKLPVSAVSLGIFLHWRELSLKAQGIDITALELDCRELAAILDARFILEALWLLGFSAGFSSFAEAYYARLEKAHPFGAKRNSIKKITLLKIERPIEQVLEPNPETIIVDTPTPNADKPVSIAIEEMKNCHSKFVDIGELNTTDNEVIEPQPVTPLPDDGYLASQENVEPQTKIQLNTESSDAELIAGKIIPEVESQAIPAVPSTNKIITSKPKAKKCDADVRKKEKSADKQKSKYLDSASSSLDSELFPPKPIKDD